MRFSLDGSGRDFCGVCATVRAWLEVADRVPLRFLIRRYFFVASRVDELLRLPCLPFLRPKLARLCCELISHQVELMCHGQIKALPCELVTPVGLLDERNARLQSLLISAASTDPKCLEQVLMISVGTLIASCSLSSSSG